MSSIPIRLELAKDAPYSVWLDGAKIVEHSQSKIEFHSQLLMDHKTHTLEIRGNVTVERLMLDGIDTEYFKYHGFTSDGARGNSDTKCVKYYFNTPIWKWYIEWRQHDNSTYRQLSKDHSGFLPL
jgi:hypothetical protein